MLVESITRCVWAAYVEISRNFTEPVGTIGMRRPWRVAITSGKRFKVGNFGQTAAHETKLASAITRWRPSTGCFDDKRSVAAGLATERQPDRLYWDVAVALALGFIRSPM